MNAKVRHDPLQLALDVPDDDALPAWAANPFRPLAGEVVFYDATQRVAHETIAFASAQCVGYYESFESGAGGDGAYVCQLSITAPAFELRSGGPAALVAVMTAVASTPATVCCGCFAGGAGHLANCTNTSPASSSRVYVGRLRSHHRRC